MIDYSIELPALPYSTIEGRVEVILTDRPQRASEDEPGHGGGIELGTIEQVVSRTINVHGDRWNYSTFPETDLGQLLEEAVRDALEADEDFMERALCYALNGDAGDRAEASERMADARRDDRMMDGAP